MPSKGNKCCCDEPCKNIGDCVTTHQYTLTTSGIDGAPVLCRDPVWNRIWTLSWNPPTIWRQVQVHSASISVRCSIFPIVGTKCRNRMEFMPLVFGVEVGHYALYECDEWDCEGSNVMNLVAEFACAPWPASITVTKV